jgi:hypothetical protein
MPFTKQSAKAAGDKGRATQKARREGVSVVPTGANEDGVSSDLLPDGSKCAGTAQLPELDIQDPKERREYLEKAAWWAATHEKGSKPPNVLAKRLLLLAEESPKEFMRGVLIPVAVPKEDRGKDQGEVASNVQTQDWLKLARECLEEVNGNRPVTGSTESPVDVVQAGPEGS